MEKVAIIGLGMIGYELVKKFLELDDYKVYIITRSDKGFFKDVEKYFIDIADENKIKETIRKINPDFVINTAAMTNVDLCETERDLAYKINALGAKYIGEACKEIGCSLCHISTDYVFDGEKGNYVEEDEINPINYYGYTKAEGERFLNELDYDSISIVRISVPYCISPVKVNFFMWVLERLKNNEAINAVIDQWNTPTYVNEFIDGAVKIYERDVRGLLHFGGGEKVSRYEFALKVAEIFGFDESLIKPVKSSELGWKAKRPRDTSLNSEKVKKLLGIKLKSVEEALKEIKKLKVETK
ncbi:dTDP-4-dehydrorhamnose reductase [Methanocaldococcus bathoardescens]|uniref:dTDP-4-dehydrorhamnose reductase n=1 Tax=Methanocaldococcus bathoardescens TaxID=1301915 RepID=A0A076LES6_9EURY|nr:dTDP-4-dehydrorhamnose reductase [Methanocaldococcus bathoardescens]AIJ04933.1 dTDP-4-dehydrorhamnose reductase [Methanocaldococcus bathoardescens]